VTLENNWFRNKISKRLSDDTYLSVDANLLMFNNLGKIVTSSTAFASVLAIQHRLLKIT